MRVQRMNIIFKMSTIKLTAEELKKRHLSAKITALDRAKEFGNDFYEDGGIMFCKSCQHSVDLPEVTDGTGTSQIHSPQESKAKFCW